MPINHSMLASKRALMERVLARDHRKQMRQTPASGREKPPVGVVVAEQDLRDSERDDRRRRRLAPALRGG